MDSPQVPELSKLAVHADLQAHLNRNIVRGDLKKTKDWLHTSDYLTAGDADDCGDFSDIWKILHSKRHIKIGEYQLLKDLFNRIGLKRLVTDIERHEKKISVQLKESTLESPVKRIYHADLQAAMNSDIVGTHLKNAKDWLFNRGDFTAENVENCKDFSDIWNTLYRLTLIEVGQYGLLRTLCSTIGLYKIVPVIEKYEQKISQVHDGNAELDEIPPVLRSRLHASSPIPDRQNSVFEDDDLPSAFVLSDFLKSERMEQFVYTRRKDEWDTPPVLMRSSSKSRGNSRASSSAVLSITHFEFQTSLGDDDDNGKQNESMDLPEEEIMDKIRRYLRPLHRTSSLPNLHTSHDQGQHAHTSNNGIDTPVDFTTTLRRPRRRCSTEQQLKLDSYITRSPSAGILHDHYLGFSPQTNRRKVSYTPSESSWHAESESLRDFVLNKLDDLDSSMQSEFGSVKSEPAYFEQASTNKEKTFSASSTSLPTFPQEWPAGNSSKKCDWLEIVQDREPEDNLRVEIYIRDKLCQEVQLQMVNQHLTHAAIYVQIATLALCNENWDWKTGLKKCQCELYSLNNLWSIMIDDCQYSATKISETFGNILLNLSNESAVLAEHDKRSMVKHVSLIQENEKEITEVTLKLERAIRQIQQNFGVFISKDGRSDLMKLVAIVLSKVNPILLKCRQILEQFYRELDQWHTEDIKMIDSGVHHVNRVLTNGEKRHYRQCMEENKIRWMALKQHCHKCSQKHVETRLLIQDLYKDDPTPGITTEMKAWRYARKMVDSPRDENCPPPQTK